MEWASARHCTATLKSRWCSSGRAPSMLLYLAWGFFRSSEQVESGQGRARGSVVFAPAYRRRISIRDTQPQDSLDDSGDVFTVLDSAKSLPTQVFQLTTAFLVVCVVCHFAVDLWRQLVLRRFRSARALRTSGARIRHLHAARGGLCRLRLKRDVAHVIAAARQRWLYRAASNTLEFQNDQS